MNNKNKVGKKKLYKNVSLVYTLTTFAFVLLLGFFLTSKMYMAEVTEVMNHELNTEYDLRSDGKFTISEWDYDRNKNMMEIVLITEGIKKYDNEINFKSISSVDRKRYLDLEVVYEDEGIYIIQIKDVPKNFDKVAIQIEKGDTSVDIFEEEAIKQEKEIDEVSVIYADQRVINEKDIKLFDVKNYAINMTQSMIEKLESGIIEREELDLQIDSQIEIVKKEIEILAEKKIYETLEEQIKTDSEMHGLEYKVIEFEKEKALIVESNSLDEKKIEKLNQKKRDLEFRK